MVFSGTPVSSTNKTNRHEITEILLKVALNTTALTLNHNTKFYYLIFLISAMSKEDLINENKMLRGQIRDLKRDCAIVRDCILQLERNYDSSKQLSPYYRYRIMKMMVKKVINDRLL